MSPICPHICEHWWTELGHKDTIANARWPKTEEANPTMLHIGNYVSGVEADFRKRLDRIRTKKTVKRCT